ncbi:YugN family protein [Paenibacillus sp.]|uniref:YugN family protein n=1 Tax=Paenibacillus sp. TaxID=58172 RepID=UPI002D48E353|nr:YugN family protein [Paenibacillus sp.]HZG56848.1 YugN family protein [Paenibacillus sp.]
MISLESELTNRELDFAELKDKLERQQFTLGGNWDYNQGCFDRRLDGEKQTVWLRIPFEVSHGQIDPDAPQPGTRVVVGTPYVLRHLYNDGDDHDAHLYLLTATVNQFQAPVDPDASVSPEYVTKAKDVLRAVASSFA